MQYLEKTYYPSSNFACTAKRITVIVNEKCPDVKLYVDDKDGQMTVKSNVDYKDIEEINETSEEEEFMVECPSFDGLPVSKPLMIIDTPGGNYSGNEEHEVVTRNALENFDNGTILYILNASQLGTEDDYKMLTDVKSIMDAKHDINLIFVLNKIDVLNRSIEDLGSYISKILLEYINKVGIKKYSIYPCSAEAALLFRKVLDGVVLAENECDKFYAYYRYFFRKSISMEQYVYDKERRYSSEEICIDGDMYSAGNIRIALSNTGIQELERKICVSTNPQINRYKI